MYRADKPFTEWLFIAYKEDLAAYQIKRLNRYIDALPEIFGAWKRETVAEGIANRKCQQTGRVFVCEPAGIMSFKRGRHPDGVIADDILKDPEVKLDISQLQKIEAAFFQEVEPMPKSELHVSGTPQDDADLFSSLEKTHRQEHGYYCRRFPAVLDFERKIALWSDLYPFDKLIAIKDRIGERAFNKEFMCKPVRGEEGFFSQEQLDRATWLKLKNYNLQRWPRLREYTYAGADIGKKVHPSHLAVFGVDRKERLVQVHSKWFDGINYQDQLEWFRAVITGFSIARFEYDATRAEFDGFAEAGQLPGEMVGKTFSLKMKHEIAAEFDRLMIAGKIKLLSERRQRGQILNCDNDLKSMETADGHGDAFWSVAMAVDAYRAGQQHYVTELTA